MHGLPGDTSDRSLEGRESVAYFPGARRQPRLFDGAAGHARKSADLCGCLATCFDCPETFGDVPSRSVRVPCRSFAAAFSTGSSALWIASISPGRKSLRMAFSGVETFP